MFGLLHRHSSSVVLIFPFISAVSRTCYEDHNFGHIKIPKGMQIMINMTDLHYNPDLWTTYDPAEFHPERLFVLMDF